jgi:SAM-dependent methyltransferase
MPDYQALYEQEAERYHTLVVAEDYRGELPRALERLTQLEQARVVEVGMGTGRITRLLLERGAQVRGYERSPAMLAVARRVLAEHLPEALLAARFAAHEADIRELRLPPGQADVAVAGWVLGHFCEWHAERWQQEIGGVLDQLWQALCPGGTLIVIETLGTGSEQPRAPNAALEAYYRWLEGSWELQREELRTDYRFPSLTAAVDSVRFFFGTELAERVQERQWQTVPECTGLWWRRK